MADGPTPVSQPAETLREATPRFAPPVRPLQLRKPPGMAALKLRRPATSENQVSLLPLSGEVDVQSCRTRMPSQISQSCTDSVVPISPSICSTASTDGQICSTSSDGSQRTEAPQELFSPKVDALLARTYVLDRCIGAGSVAKVHVARRRSDDSQVAVKCIHSGDHEVRLFARQEYDLMSSLRHTAVVQVHEIFEGQRASCIVMEFCEDGTLHSWVKREGQLAEGLAVTLFRHLLTGVDYLHHKRIVHRDLKPDNLLLSSGATVLKISDFNSARRLGLGPEDSCTHMLSDRGTAAFRAPELRFGRLWNERIDIWACGLCSYYMLKTCLPFNIDNRQVLADLYENRLPKVDWDGISPPMRYVVSQCLSVDMSQRPPAMELLMLPIFTSIQATTRSRRHSDFSMMMFSMARCSPDGTGDKGVGTTDHQDTFHKLTSDSPRDSAFGSFHHNRDITSMMEPRSGVEALRRLAGSKYERDFGSFESATQENIDSPPVDPRSLVDVESTDHCPKTPKPMIDPGDCPARRKKKFFTTALSVTQAVIGDTSKSSDATER